MNYQGFLSAWKDLLSFSVPFGTGNIAGLWFSRWGGLVPSLKLCIYFLVNVSYIICKSTLFEMTFEIHFYQKTLHTFKNICWNTFIVHQGRLWTGICFQVLQIWSTYFPHDHQMRPSENSYAVATFIANSLVSFFNLMISEYMLKIAATFVTSSKAV